MRKTRRPSRPGAARFRPSWIWAAIAKGFACDLVTERLAQMGFTEGHFVCGGSSISLLSRPEGGDYGLTLAKPRTGRSSESYFATVFARNTTVSTSSDANHTYTLDGVIYCHIIDPRTGYPTICPRRASRSGGLPA